jgi:single-strand DNA-binding protein
MGATTNLVVLQGRLGRDPEVRFTGGGQAVANFSIATDESYKNKDGEKIKNTEWHNIVVWGKSAEFVQKYIKTGDLVQIIGKLRTRKWSDKEGNDRYTTEIVATETKGVITSGTGDEEQHPQQNRAASTKSTQSSGKKSGYAGKSTQNTAPEINDEDIPF